MGDAGEALVGGVELYAQRDRHRRVVHLDVKIFHFDLELTQPGFWKCHFDLCRLPHKGLCRVINFCFTDPEYTFEGSRRQGHGDDN